MYMISHTHTFPTRTSAMIAGGHCRNAVKVLLKWKSLKGPINIPYTPVLSSPWSDYPDWKNQESNNASANVVPICPEQPVVENPRRGSDTVGDDWDPNRWFHPSGCFFLVLSTKRPFVIGIISNCPFFCFWNPTTRLSSGDFCSPAKARKGL